MICNKCKKEVDNESLFCCHCGNKNEKEYDKSVNNEEIAVLSNDSEITVKTNSNIKRNLIICALICVGIVIVFITLWCSSVLNRQIGDFTNLSKEEATLKTEELGFSNIEIKYEPSDTISKGLITRQSINSETKLHDVDENEKIIFYISKGKYATIFNCKGLKEEDVVDEFKKLGFKNIEIKSQLHNSVKPGNIISANYKDGDVLPVDTKIEITVCSAQGIFIHSFEGKEESIVIKKIENLGLRCDIEYVYTGDAILKDDDLFVTSQSANGWVKKGSLDSIAIKVIKPSVSINSVHKSLNSVGGLDITISFKNESNKTINYIDTVYKVKNSVEDEVACRIHGFNHPKLHYTGPLKPNESQKALWGAAVYNSTITQIHINKLSVEFSDGTSQDIESSWYWY